MRNIGKIYKKDLKNILTNWVALVVTLGLIILPALYAWFNIKSSWDPYGNTKGIKVAVVNLDKGGDLVDKEYNIGDQIVSNLKENDKIGWNFLSEEEGIEGVTNGKYYATIIIPEDFTERLLSITTTTIEYPSLKYIVNEKTNAIAPKITDKGVSSVKEEVNSSVVKTVDGIIFKVLNSIGIEVQGSKPEIRRFIDAVYKVNDNLGDIETLISEAYEGTEKIESIIEKINEAIPVVQDTINESEDVLLKSKRYLEKASEGLKELEPTIKQDLIVSRDIVARINELIGQIDVNNFQGEALNLLTVIEGKITSVDSSIESLITVLQNVNKIINNSSIKEAINTLTEVRKEVENVAALVQNLINGVNNGNSEELVSKIENLKSVVSNIDATLQTLVNNYDSSIMPAIEGGINQLTKIANNGLYLLGEAEGILPDFESVLSTLDKGSDLAREDLGILNDKFPNIADKIRTFAEEVKNVDDEEQIDKVLDILTRDWNEKSDFLASPVNIDEEKLFPIPNYGSAMSPFFSTLSLWVGALILVSLFTVEAKSHGEEEYSSIEEYFGKLLTFVTIASMQGLVVILGDIYLLKTYVVEKALLILLGVLISVIFMTIIYTLVSLFGNVGKAIGVILLVLQISASGGTFPVEVMPEFFQRIHPLLPFKYAIGAMREAVGGVVLETLIRNVIFLLIYFIVFLLIGIFLKKIANKLGKGFSEKLKESELIGH